MAQTSTSTEAPSATVVPSTATGTITEYGSLDGWYGWQLVVADQLVGAAMFWTSVAIQSEPLLYTWVGFGIANGPILHLANGNADGGMWSLLLRLLPPATAALGAYVGSRIDDSDKDVWSGFSWGVIVGAIVGWQITSAPGAVIDYVFLSWDEEPEGDEPIVGIVPILRPDRNGDVRYGAALSVTGW